MTPRNRIPSLKWNGRRCNNSHNTLALSTAGPLVALVEDGRLGGRWYQMTLSIARVGLLAYSCEVAQYRTHDRNRDANAALRGTVLA